MLTGQPGFLMSTKEGRKLCFFALLLVLALGLFFYLKIRPGMGREAAGVLRPSEKLQLVENSLPSNNSGSGMTEESQPLGTGEPGEAKQSGETGAEAPSAAAAASERQPADEAYDITSPTCEIKDKEQVIEEEYFYEIIKFVNRTPMPELKSMAVQAEFGEYFANPQNWRGKVLHIDGRIRRLVQRRPEQLPKGVPVLYEAQVMDPKGFWYFVFVTEKPRHSTDDLVTFDAVFMKVYGYENRKGSMTLAPLIVCRNFEAMKIPPWQTERTIGWSLVIMVIIVSIVSVLIYRSQLKSSRAAACRIEEKRLEQGRRWAEAQRRRREQGDDKKSIQGSTPDGGKEASVQGSASDVKDGPSANAPGKTEDAG